MGYEYKCVAAPEKARRRRGAKSRTARVAGAMEDILKAEAVDGWEYQRTDLIPIEEKSGLFSRAHEVHRAVMVFRKPLAGSTAPALRAPAQDVEQPKAPVPVQATPEPVATEPVPVKQTPNPEPSEVDGEFRLAAEREPAEDLTARPQQPIRAPQGLG